jgi:hypothetical protein
LITHFDTGIQATLFQPGKREKKINEEKDYTGHAEKTNPPALGMKNALNFKK